MAEEIIKGKAKTVHVDTPELDSNEPNVLPLLPLKNVVILPKSIIPIIVGRQSSIQAVEHALKKDKTIFITAQKDPDTEAPGEDDVFHHGTKSTILQVMRMPNGALKILAEGIQRAQITATEHKEGFLGVQYRQLPTKNAKKTVELEALWRQLQSLYTTYAELNDKAPAELTNSVKTARDMDYIADTVTVHITNLSFKERQTILEMPDLHKRILKICGILQNEVEILQTEQRIRGRVQTQVEKSQREYYLNEQMKAIQKELGREDQATEVAALREKIDTLNLPNDVQEKAERELRRLEQMPALSSEAVVSKNYIDWIISLPWHTTSKDSISITQAEKLLHNSHAGLKKPKERITEFLAAKKFSKKLERSPILCLVGPPGVGKTSLAHSVAESLNREFVRISLGGVRDEAEIRGHRRTYIGALPGKIIQAMKKAKTLNPVILMDEIDKMSCDMHGDPGAALLEVLDPEQNKGFVDHFLDVEYDLSKALFITTANSLDGIPYPLYDRLEIIPISGYTDQEKEDIAKKFLIPKNLKEYSLEKKQFRLSSTQLKTVIASYTKEAGVRQLERIIAKLMRKTIQELLKNKESKAVTITAKKITEWLGHPPFKKTSLSGGKERIGLATGLAWTEVGGDVMEIEVSALSGKGNVTLTGQLGDVMQESAQAALSYIRSRTRELGLRASFHTNKDIHIHIPEGATPKDGPSAGITMGAALISALTKTATKPYLALSGEVTLQGRVLAVGGLKEKLLAAQQHGVKILIVPHENYDDIQDILKEISIGDIEIQYARTMDDVAAHAFVAHPKLKKASSKKR